MNLLSLTIYLFIFFQMPPYNTICLHHIFILRNTNTKMSASDSNAFYCVPLSTGFYWFLLEKTDKNHRKIQITECAKCLLHLKDLNCGPTFTIELLNQTLPTSTQTKQEREREFFIKTPLYFKITSKRFPLFLT